jgi:hypothetical protein
MAQKKGAVSSDRPKPHIRVNLIYAAIILFGILSANLLFYLLGVLNKVSVSVTKPVLHSVGTISGAQLSESVPSVLPVLIKPKVPVVKAGNFILNGIFSSEDGDYALVNNRIVKEGDFVDGAIVTLISEDEVEMELNGAKFILSSQ